MQTFFRIATLALGVVIIAASAIALAIGLAWWLRQDEPSFGTDTIRLQPVVQPGIPETLPEGDQSAVGTMDGELKQVEAEYEKAKQELDVAMSTEDRSGSGALLQDDLGIIETAITDIVLALSLNPDSESLKRALIRTYQKEVELLRKSLHLSDDE